MASGVLAGRAVPRRSAKAQAAAAGNNHRVTPASSKQAYRRNAVVCRAEAPASGATTAPATATSNASNGTVTPTVPLGEPQSLSPLISVDVAVAAKLNAARELARRLAAERQAVATGNGASTAQARKSLEEASVAAATTAARADALARALKRAEGSRDQVSRVQAQNEALRELLLEMAPDKEAARARLEQVLAATVSQNSSSTSMASALASKSSSTFSKGLTPLPMGSSGATGSGAAVPPATPATVASSATDTRTDIADAARKSAEVDEVLSHTTSAKSAAPVAASQSAEGRQAGGEREEEAIPPPNVLDVSIESMDSADLVATPPAQAEPPKQAPAAAATATTSSGAAPSSASDAATDKPGSEAVGGTSQSDLERLQAELQAEQEREEALQAQILMLEQQQLKQRLAVQQKLKQAKEAAALAAQKKQPVAASSTSNLIARIEQAQAQAAAAARQAPPVPERKPPQQPAPPAVEDRGPPRVSQAELRQLASKALYSNYRSFTVPAESVPVGRPCTLYYNRASGPLKPTGALAIKAGLNKWETIINKPFQRCSELPSSQQEEWWSVVLDLPADLFQFAYVVVDTNSNTVDNNSSTDYPLPLRNAPSEAQVLEKRAKAFREAEAERKALLAAEEARLWKRVALQELEVATHARLDYRRRREGELMAAARALAAERRKPLDIPLPAAPYKPNVYAWAQPPVGGTRVLLAYNKAVGPIAQGRSVRLHMGFDNWFNKITQTVDFSPLSPVKVELLPEEAEGGPQAQWHGAYVDVPECAASLNFVFSDQEQRLWDNNRALDFHTLVEGAAEGEELAQQLFYILQQEAAPTEQDGEDRAAARAVRKTQAKALAMRKRRTARQEFLYTLPLTPVAGQPVDIFYNPNATVLRGRPDIYLRGSWNRGAGKQHMLQRMEPTASGVLGFLKTTVQVPANAWALDLIFSDNDANSGGFYDTNGNLGYHIPVEGSGASAPRLKIVHIACEMAPIAKVGGMGDVVTALGRAVQDEGHDVEVIIPKYDCINYAQVEDLRQEAAFGFGGTNVRVWRGQVEGLLTTFLEPENGHFWVGCIYGRNNDAQRFGFFCGAALQYLKNRPDKADVLHCHDWQSAPCAFGDKGAARTVFTIHNLSYGGDLIGKAMAACDVATTVSPTYAKEISGDRSIAPHLGKLYGVLNGIDVDIWDPAEDRALPINFTINNWQQGKDAAKRELRKRLNLGDMNVPIVGCVTRLVAQKGIHLIKHAAWRTLERGGQFVLLGSAPDGRVQAEFNALRDTLSRQYHDRVALVFTYDEPLSHLIYAGSDMFLVPSMFEPCGLTQMIAMRYGTIPVVRKTGGLVDTVFDVDHDEARAEATGMGTNGFSFEGTDVQGMDYALNRALSTWYSDKPAWQAITERAMVQDWSWSSPALDYIELYYRAINGKR